MLLIKQSKYKSYAENGSEAVDYMHKKSYW